MNTLQCEAEQPESTTCTSSVQAVGPERIPEQRTGAIRQISLCYILSGSRKFILRRELRPELKWEESLCLCELDSLNLMGYGDTFYEAVGRFMNDFAATYDALVSCEDRELTKDAQTLRDELQSLVISVSPTEHEEDRSESPPFPYACRSGFTSDPMTLSVGTGT